MSAKRLYFVTTVSDLGSFQTIHECIDLHELAVDVLKALPPLQGDEYTDARVVKELQSQDLWDAGKFYLISVFDPVRKTLVPLVQDTGAKE